MRDLFRMLLLPLVLLTHLAAVAQTQTVSGNVVSSKDGAPLDGASVQVKGGTSGVETDSKGNFTINAPAGSTLVVTYLGFTSREYKVGSKSSGITIGLVPADNSLEEVVVAMDIKRKPRELGYSTQTVSGREINETQRQNFVNGLQGRIAGLTITPTTGLAGASSQVVLRGFNSISLSNQPLFVVDGIILDNSTMNEDAKGGGGLGLAGNGAGANGRQNRNNDYTNRIADLNPNDIATITVLKGPEATALYGSQASSGAIVITTKKAVPGKVGLNYDNAFRVTKLTRTNETLDTYSAGTNGNSSYPGATFNYFGPAYPENTASYDNVDAFFKTGFSQLHNIGADFGTKNAGFRASGSYFDESSVIPTNKFKKLNFRLANTTKINKYISISPAVQFIRSENDKPMRGTGSYLVGLYLWPKEHDIRNYVDEQGNKIPLYQADYNAETDNPLFNANKNRSSDLTERYIATMGVDITPTDWLTINGRFGYDRYNTEGSAFYHPQSASFSAATGGWLDNYWRRYEGYNHTITATAKKDFGKFSTRVMVGTMWQDYKTQMFAVAGNKLKSVNSTDSSNTDPSTRVRLNRNTYGEYNDQILRQMAYFGEAGIGYNNYAFLSYSHRFEAASVFPKVNRKYNYPGVSLSLIMSDMLGLKQNVLSYWKLRGSYAQTARLPDPYRNQSVFVNNYASASPQVIPYAYSYGFDNNNPNLAPERQKTFEIGTELKFFNNLVSLDATYYNTLCVDQISQGYRASYATGFILNTQNAASTRNQGIELVLDVNPVNRADFNWNVRFNFNHAWNEVLSLPEAIASEYYIAETWLYGNARGGLYRNNPTTTITGFHYQRNKKGDILINPATGLPVVESTFTPIGDRNPLFTLGTLNSFRYKNWSLSFLWDLKVGGDIFNATEMLLTLNGKSKRTEDRMTPRVIKGVLNDANANSDNPTQNTTVITPYYTTAYYTQMPEEEFVQKNVNWFRLRDLTLNYNFRTKNNQVFVKGIKSLGLFLTASDLVLITNYRGADPAVNGVNAAASGVGGFGFDYASLPTPVAINIGLRAGF
ncbi:MAG: SusC/RagA family TonB-linked outer membrane protein [Chitinophagaceae bacterium]|nr:MAG: SusC/RagA family TonB-linked outer membrane protein [Chitinophagaceae bacterium]